MNTHHPSTTVIIGGGLTGMTTALFLATRFSDTHHRLVVNKALTDIQDARTFVLFHSTYTQLLRHGIVFDNTNTINKTRLQLADTELMCALSIRSSCVIIRAATLYNQLIKALARLPNIQICVATVDAIDSSKGLVTIGSTSISAQLICLCTGDAALAQFVSEYRQFDFATNAWIFSYRRTDEHNAHTALFALHTQGHIALLPAIDSRSGHATGVATLPNSYQQTDVIQFLTTHTALAKSTITIQSHYPLREYLHTPLIQQQTVLLGHAAHLLHPIGAQGFNLTVHTLVRLVATLSANNDTKIALMCYQKQVLPTIHTTLRNTHRLATLHLHPIQYQIAQYLLSFARCVPHALSCLIDQRMVR